MDSLFKWIDKNVGNTLIVALSPFALLSRRKISEPRNILVVRLWTLGETLLTFPMISELRKRYPQAKIAVLCRSQIKDVFELNTDVDEIVLFEDFLRNFFRFSRYDCVIDTEPWFKVSALMSFWLGKRRIGFSHGLRRLMYTSKVKFEDQQYEAQTFLDLLKPLGINAKFSSYKKITVARSEEEKVEKILAENGIKKGERLIGICPGAEDALYRMWMPGGFAAVSDYLQKKYGAKIVVIGSKKEWDLCESVRGMAKTGKKMVNLAGKVNKTQLFYLVEKLDLLITNDTGPMHVAAVQNTKSVSLFGPNLPVRFAPRTKGSAHIYKGDGNAFINVHKGEIPSANERKYYEPIEQITIDDVRRACDKVLGGK